MANWLKILLFGGGVAIAGFGTAYLTGSFDPWLEPERPVVASLPDAETLPEPAALQVEGADEIETPAVGAGEEETTPDAADADDLVIPAFDLVRVEPDGSVVIAGRAAPNATVEVLTGSRVIATVEAGPDGDFAAVLDEPLEPGDYQIVLRSTTDENVVVTSVETAIVSVPETPDGQVLALVEQPGSPSRLITVPDATSAQPLEEGSEVAEATPEAETTEETDLAATPETQRAEDGDATAGSPEAQDEDVAGAPEDEAAETEAAAAVEGEGEAETDPATEDDVAELAPATEEPATQPNEATADASEQDQAEVFGTEEEAMASAGSDEPTDAAEAPSEAIEEEAGTDTAQTDEPAQPEDDTAGTTDRVGAEQDVAALQQEESFEPDAQEPGAQTRVFVEAVEIDGDTVFVAGQAEPGRYIRVYANEILLGETLVSEGGRFLIEAQVDLPVGDYIIRADLLGSDGSVVARAAVPFEREPGETVAAVAPRMPAPREDADQQAAGDEDQQTVAGEDQQAADEDVPAAVTLAEPDASEPTPSGDMASAPAEEEAQAEEMAAGEEAASDVDAGREEQPQSSIVATEPQPSTDGAPSEMAEASDEETATPSETAQPAPETASEEEMAATQEPEAPAGVAETDPAAEPDVDAADDRMAAAETSEETLSPALERANGAVIIRRGDNLWRISRRVYGQGVRFSTIYLANQGQISDPDRIWPGQVFAVPAETVEGETADLEALGEQAVDPSQVPGEIIR